VDLRFRKNDVPPQTLDLAFHLSGLSALELNNLSQARLLPQLNSFPHLWNLSLKEENWDEYVTIACQNAPQIGHLALKCKSLNESQLRCLAQLSKLETLDLEIDCLSDEILDVFAQWQDLTGLELKTRLTGAQVARFAEMKRLNRLTLTDCPLEPEAWSKLGDLSQLRSLIVEGVAIPPAAWPHLRRATTD